MPLSIILRALYNAHLVTNENFAYGEINERSFSNPHPKLRFINLVLWNDQIKISSMCMILSVAITKYCVVLKGKSDKVVHCEERRV